MSFNKQAYNNEYNKKTYTGISFRLNNVTDKDILDCLKQSEGNMKEYICKLIRSDIKTRERRRGIKMNRSGRPENLDWQRWPFEIIEFTNGNDRYTVGFAAGIEQARSVALHHVETHPDAGATMIYQRTYDDYVKAVIAVQVI